MGRFGKKSIGIFLLFCLGMTGCEKKALEYTITVAGEATGAREVSFLEQSIPVYQDEASNACGDCAYQPAHLYVGADAKETAQAIADAVDRADDLWEVASCKGDTVVLREKEAGSIEEIAQLTAPQGLVLSGAVSGREVPVVSKSRESVKEEGVSFPENPQRLAAVYGPSYELLTMLGAEEKIVVRADVQTEDFPWAEKVFKRIAELPRAEQCAYFCEF